MTLTSHISLAFMLLSASIALCGITPEEYGILREQALARPRRIFADNDGCDVTAFPHGNDFSLDSIQSYMNGWLKGTQVDTLVYCPSMVGFMMSTRSNVSDRYYIKLHVPNLDNNTELLHQMGTDGLEQASLFARRNGLEILAGMRINDQHERWAPPANYAPFKKAHPELLLGSSSHATPYGSWLCFDFSHEVVRQRFLDIARELLTSYDLDGLEIDFDRVPVLFPSVANGGVASPEETALITELFRGLHHRRPLVIAPRRGDG